MTLGAPEKKKCARTTASLLVNKQHGLNLAILAANCLPSLPDDVIYVILRFCDVRTLGRLSQVSRRLWLLISQDCVWLPVRKSLALEVGDSRSKYNTRRRPYRQLAVKEQCRCSMNWSKGHFQEYHLIHHGVKQMPWMQLENSRLWVSYKNIVRCYRQQPDGNLKELTNKTLRGHQDDIGRFVVKDNMVVTAGRDRRIHAYNSLTGEPLVQLQDCHSGDIQAVDFHQDTAVTGSRDATVKVWNLRENNSKSAHMRTLAVNDRVWSLAMNPNGRSFITGTAGINHVPPLRIWDTESCQELAVLGSQYKYGAGVLDIQYETQDIVLSCGYDTLTRLWDLRQSHAHCVMSWEEPFDSTLYCVKSDGNNAIVTGTARYGMVRLWDKRHVSPVQLYYSGRTSSPVYSLVFDTGHLYLALDKGINMLDFTIPG